MYAITPPNDILFLFSWEVAIPQVFFSAINILASLTFLMGIDLPDVLNVMEICRHGHIYQIGTIIVVSSIRNISI